MIFGQLNAEWAEEIKSWPRPSVVLFPNRIGKNAYASANLGLANPPSRALGREGMAVWLSIDALGIRIYRIKDPHRAKQWFVVLPFEIFKLLL